MLFLDFWLLSDELLEQFFDNLDSLRIAKSSAVSYFAKFCQKFVIEATFISIKQLCNFLVRVPNCPVHDEWLISDVVADLATPFAFGVLLAINVMNDEICKIFTIAGFLDQWRPEQSHWCTIPVLTLIPLFILVIEVDLYVALSCTVLSVGVAMKSFYFINRFESNRRLIVGSRLFAFFELIWFNPFTIIIIVLEARVRAEVLLLTVRHRFGVGAAASKSMSASKASWTILIETRPHVCTPEIFLSLIV